jgi:hypothetical protein
MSQSPFATSNDMQPRKIPESTGEIKENNCRIPGKIFV